MAKAKYTTLLWMFLGFSVMGQDIKTVRDIGLWANVGINYKVGKKWRLSFNQDIRFFDNVSKLAKATTELGAQYKINEQFRLGADVRYAYDRKSDYRFTNDIRYNIDFKYRLKLSKTYQLEYRLRYQNNFIDLFTYYDEDVRKSNVRSRIEIERKLNDHSITLGGELFREYVLYRKPYFNILRLTLGDKVKGKLGDFEYSMNYARQLNVKYPLNFFFICVGYTFNFKHG